MRIDCGVYKDRLLGNIVTLIVGFIRTIAEGLGFGLRFHRTAAAERRGGDHSQRFSF